MRPIIRLRDSKETIGMRRLWPFSKSEQSFEAILSELSSSIQSREVRVQEVRLRARRWKALFTLYSGFAYVFYLIIMVFAIGWREWNPRRVTGLALGPTLIYGVRYCLNFFYERIIRNQETQLEFLRARQREKIEELKTKTNFYSTQSLLDRYSGSPSSRSLDESRDSPRPSPKQSASDLRNRRRSNFRNDPSTPENSRAETSAVDIQHQRGAAPQVPTAFIPPAVQEELHNPRWYDRLLDVIVGEDENRLQNRYALICNKCHMHNGLAPPGEKNVHAVKYICPRCGHLNGERHEGDNKTSSIKADEEIGSLKSVKAGEEVPTGEEFMEDD